MRIIIEIEKDEDIEKLKIAFEGEMIRVVKTRQGEPAMPDPLSTVPD
jgi:hypothetical protein